MFKVGDIVIGNEGANKYLYTKQGVKCRVIDVRGKFIDVEVEIEGKTNYYTVDSMCFDLFESGEHNNTGKTFEFTITIEDFKKLMGVGEDDEIIVSGSPHNPYRIEDDHLVDGEGNSFTPAGALVCMNGFVVTIKPTEVKEMTLEEISKELGYKVKIKEN